MISKVIEPNTERNISYPEKSNFVFSFSTNITRYDLSSHSSSKIDQQWTLHRKLVFRCRQFEQRRNEKRKTFYSYKNEMSMSPKILKTSL